MSRERWVLWGFSTTLFIVAWICGFKVLMLASATTAFLAALQALFE